MLVVKLIPMDRDQLRHFESYKTFAEVHIPTVKGEFKFVFKEDRRKRIKFKRLSVYDITTYFVELQCPEEYNIPSNYLYGKVIIVILVKLFKINYEALGRVLLDLYLDTYQEKTTLTRYMEDQQ